MGVGQATRIYLPTVGLFVASLCIVGSGALWLVDEITRDASHGEWLYVAEFALVLYLAVGVTTMAISVRGFRRDEPVLPALVLAGILGLTGSVVAAANNLYPDIPFVAALMLGSPAIPVIMTWVAYTRFVD